MINTNNYFDSIKTLHVSKFPKELKFGYDFTKDVTENHTTWDYYNDDDELKASVDEYLANLKTYLAKENNTNKKEKNSKVVSESSAREAAKDLIRRYVVRGDSYESIRSGQMGSYNDEYNATIKGKKIEVSEVKGKASDWNFTLQSIFNDVLEESGMAKSKANPAKTSIPNTKSTQKKETPTKHKAKPSHQKESAKQTEPNQVERIDEEVKFIRRFVLLNKKEKTNTQILSFINQLQKAIIERRIRKASPYAKQIEFVQDSLLKFYKSMKSKGTLAISDNVLELLTTIGGSEKVRLSINYMKRFVGIHGKQITKDKAKQLFNLIVDAVQKGKIKKTDPYFKKINEVLASLKHFYEIAKRNETLEVHEAVLNGLEGTLSGIGCVECDGNKKRCKSSLKGLAGIEEEDSKPIQTENTVMNSMDFSELKFDTIGFMGKWKELIGDPSEGFTAMVFGKPKMGKSYFSIDWAGYLARHHGNTLYVAKEEKLDKTLQLKIKDKKVEHPNLFFSDYLIEDLTPFQYIFLDSVTSLKLTPEDLRHLENNNPGKSFIYVFQVNKAGSARGTNEYVHNVDIVVEIPERGKAVQFGRFNQGGEMEIFE